jgi:hypothetical protein
VKYALFIDESGDHGLTTLNTDFPVFLLCGVLISFPDYQDLNKRMVELKTGIWGEKKVILHSRDIRKCEKEFSVLFDLGVKANFYKNINEIISNTSYTIIASAINKKLYIQKYGTLSDDVYELALSFMIERAVFFLDDIPEKNKELHIVIERRGKKEDKKLEEHFQRLLARGTGYVSADRLKAYNLQITFKLKLDNINGLQLADLIAYPIARHVIDKNRANPSFDILEPKFYKKNGKTYGLKIHP